MAIREGEHWICSNPNCRSQTYIVISAGTAVGTSPKCSCGSRMKKKYTAPGFRAIEHPDELEAYRRKFFSKV